MSSDGTILDTLSIGMAVNINPQDDKSREKRVEGKIAKLLTKAPSHPHGILVELTSGETGRVKEIISEGNIAPSDVKPKINNDSEVENLILKGENHFTEFKSSMLWSERLPEEQIKKNSSRHVQQYGRAASRVIIASAIAGFLNADGGVILIGVKENKDTSKDEVIGVSSEFKKLKDPCEDGYRRKILDSIVKPYLPSFIFNHFNNYLAIDFPMANDETICRIQITKSDEKVFAALQKEESFFVRIDASTRQLRGEEIVDYCIKRFT